MRRNRWLTIGLIASIFVLTYVATRLVNLTLLPIFTDEAIYIRWAQIGSRDANWRFISLVDGKQPMFTWIMMVFLKVIRDPLYAGRLVSVVSGLGTMLGMWLLSFELFKSKKISFIVAFLYLISPFTLMYDRLALYDSLVATFSVWSLYGAVLMVRFLRLDVALLLGMALGAGMLNKSSGFLSLYFLPFTLILFDWKAKDRMRRLCIWVGLALIATIVSQLLYSVLRLSPLLHMVRQKDAVFIYPFKEWLMHPFNFVVGNLSGQFDWLFRYMTVPVAILSFFPIIIFWKNTREKILLYAWWSAPFVALALFAKVLYPRFILFMVMPLYILAALTIAWIMGRLHHHLWKVVLVILILFPSLFADYYIITNPLYAPLPFSDKMQLVDDWPSGWGIVEVNAFLAGEAKKGSIAVYTDGTFGLLPYAIELYLVDNPNVKIKGIWPLTQDPPEEMLTDALKKPTYMVFNQTQIMPLWPMEKIAEYQKGNQKDRKLRLYKIVQ
jgi:4-amino-4-deoxy-L-arabinose transferase-like glycosyltransferase